MLLMFRCSSQLPSIEHTFSLPIVLDRHPTFKRVAPCPVYSCGNAVRVTCRG